MFRAPGIAHHIPAITRQIRAVNDQRADGPLARRLLELIGPTAVISQGLALEELRIPRRRFIHDHENDLALDVHALEVVPLVFGCFNSVADEDDGRIDLDAVGLGLVAGNVVLAQLQGHCRTLPRRPGRRGAQQGLCADEIHLLQEGAVVAGGLQAVQRELRCDVIRGDIPAARAGGAALEQIIGQESHVLCDAMRIDTAHRRNDSSRKIELRPDVRRRLRSRQHSRTQAKDQRGLEFHRL